MKAIFYTNMLFFSAVVIFSWMIQTRSSVPYFVCVIAFLLNCILSINSNFKKKSFLYVCVILMLSTTSIAILRIMSAKSFVEKLNYENEKIQYICCDEKSCPINIDGWFKRFEKDTTVEKELVSNIFFGRLYYQPSKDRRSYTLKLKFGFDDISYLVGGLSDCTVHGL